MSYKSFADTNFFFFLPHSFPISSERVKLTSICRGASDGGGQGDGGVREGKGGGSGKRENTECEEKKEEEEIVKKAARKRGRKKGVRKERSKSEESKKRAGKVAEPERGKEEMWGNKYGRPQSGSEGSESN